MSRIILTLLALLPVIAASPVQAETQVKVARNVDTATSAFQFESVPRPRAGDSANAGEWSIVDGQLDANSGPLQRLSDGIVPRSADQPHENVFFNAGSEGGRIGLDLKQQVQIDHIASYSWHPAERAPQVYTLYGSNGDADKFEANPKRPIDPTSVGWTRIADVDTRPTDGGGVGGQYGVNISDNRAALSSYRYLMWDVRATQEGSRFGHTFFSEIDIVDASAPSDPATTRSSVGISSVTFGDQQQYTVTVDTSEAPDLTGWTEKELLPVVQEWYPKIVAMLPSQGYVAPGEYTITLDPNYDGVAATVGTNVVCSPDWFRRNLQGEAKGAVVHELVHVVQQYWRGRPRGERRESVPGWVTEGVADAIRWHLYEPQSEQTEAELRAKPGERYDAAYRPSAKFIAWVQIKYNTDLVEQLNAVARNGQYTDDFWMTATSHSLVDLVQEWTAKTD